MTEEPISIFQDLEEHEKNKNILFLWRKARVARRIIAALTILNAIVFIYTWATLYFDILQLAVTVAFAACYFFSKNKPYLGVMTALIIYIILLPLYLYNMHYNPVDKSFRFPSASEIFGFAIRILIIIYLIKGTMAAKKYEVLLKS